MNYNHLFTLLTSSYVTLKGLSLYRTSQFHQIQGIVDFIDDTSCVIREPESGTDKTRSETSRGYTEYVIYRCFTGQKEEAGVVSSILIKGQEIVDIVPEKGNYYKFLSGKFVFVPDYRKLTYLIHVIASKVKEEKRFY